MRLRAIELLGWLAKGLAMRGHPRASKPMDTALAYLEAASLDMATAQEEAAASAEQDNTHKLASANSEGIDRAAAGVAGSRPEEDELEGWDDAFDAKEARAMAGVFLTMLSEGLGIARLDDSTHARGRVLWKQKVYSLSLGVEIETTLQALSGPMQYPHPADGTVKYEDRHWCTVLQYYCLRQPGHM